MQLTPTYGLKKPEGTDVVNIEDFNDNSDVLDGKLKTIETEVAATKKSVSDGKELIAAAITQKKVQTAADATFTQMANNIESIIAGSGNAAAADVLAPKTFTNSTGTEQAGTMVNRGAVSQSLAINGTYTVPAGYHNGSGKVTQTITTKGAYTYTPGTSSQTIAAGQYLSGIQTISSLGGTATAAVVRSGYTFSSDSAGRAVSGTLASLAGGTYTPSTVTQTIASSGKYMTSNVVISAIPSNYYNINTQQTVFNGGSYMNGVDAYYYSGSISSNTAVKMGAVTISNSSLYIPYYPGTDQYDRIIIRQSFPKDAFPYVRIIWGNDYMQTRLSLSIYNTSRSTIYSYTHFAPSTGADTTTTVDLTSVAAGTYYWLTMRTGAVTGGAGPIWIRKIELLKSI